MFNRNEIKKQMKAYKKDYEKSIEDVIEKHSNNSNVSVLEQVEMVANILRDKGYSDQEISIPYIASKIRGAQNI